MKSQVDIRCKLQESIPLGLKIAKKMTLGNRRVVGDNDTREFNGDGFDTGALLPNFRVPGLRSIVVSLDN